MFLPIDSVVADSPKQPFLSCILTQIKDPPPPPSLRQKRLEGARECCGEPSCEGFWGRNGKPCWWQWIYSCFPRIYPRHSQKSFPPICFSKTGFTWSGNGKWPDI